MIKTNTFSRRGLLKGAAALAATKLPAEESNEYPIAFTEDVSRDAVSEPPYAYIGVYSGGSSARGIGIYHYDPATLALTPVSIVAPVASPSFIVLDATRRFLYSGNESGAGTASAFSVNPLTGSLRFLNTQNAGGQPAHIAVHPGGKHVLTANYTGGTVAVFPIAADGSLGATTQVVQHFGELGTNTGRQEAPHPHMVLSDTSGRYVLVNDLGIDATIVYTFDATAGRLTEVNRVASAPGAGPRHLAWHPNGRIIYSVNELTNTLNAYAWDGNGNLTPVQENLSTLPTGWRGNSGAGEVLVDQAGRFLYASNRGNDNIVICGIDQTNFRLTVLGWVHTQGRQPRHFNFDPSGNYLLVGNQDSANIVTFKVDKATGALTAAGLYTSQLTPACIQFG